VVATTILKKTRDKIVCLFLFTERNFSMADNKQTDSSQPEGIAGQPNPDNSQTPGVQPNSQLDAESLWKALKPLVERDFQSGKDKAIAKLEERMSGYQPVLDRLKGIVSDEELAKITRDLEFEDLKERVYGNQRSTDQQPGTRADNGATDMATVVDEVFGLPDNDPRVTDLKLQYKNDPKGYLSAAIQLAAKISSQKESTPAEQPMQPGGTYRQPDNPIENITDSKELYRLAAKQMATSQKGRRGS
jgi:hypothetical protein